jgi:hypothetical protein
VSQGVDAEIYEAIQSEMMAVRLLCRDRFDLPVLAAASELVDSSSDSMKVNPCLPVENAFRSGSSTCTVVNTVLDVGEDVRARAITLTTLFSGQSTTRNLVAPTGHFGPIDGGKLFLLRYVTTSNSDLLR